MSHWVKWACCCQSAKSHDQSFMYMLSSKIIKLFDIHYSQKLVCPTVILYMYHESMVFK